MTSSEYIHKSHNVSVLLYHFVCPAKYRRFVFSDVVEEALSQICAGIAERYDWIKFLEVGADKNHVHFLIQSTPSHSPAEIIKIVKGVSARRIFEEHPEVKRKLWGGELWSDGYFVSTVGKSGNEEAIAKYVREQGKEECGDYRQLSFLSKV